MTLRDLLHERGLATALIVDDAYDEIPQAEDIVADEEAWANFFDDLGEDRKVLAEVFPAFESLDASALRHSDEFVAAVWKSRDKIRAKVWEFLFSAYEQATRSDREFLDWLHKALGELGIEPIPSGRQVPNEGRTANLIFADLFLGTAQEPANIEAAINRLKDLLKGREDDPPLVVLMSRSELLDDKKVHFRDSASLLGTMFRVYRKQQLQEGATLPRTLERLALHRPDALKVAKFLYCWEKGLSAASTRFLKGIRRLDLSDYAQIREVLLTFEGQPLGSYLLDVFDKVLQHEIEGDDETITAAEELNKIDPSVYPAPYISGTTDLQDLVYRSIWQNPLRLKVKTTLAEIPVGFGDVLIRRSILHPSAEPVDDDTPDIMVVLTPACDLVRENAAKRIMLLGGKLSDLAPNTWTYSEKTVKTPIVVLGGERRMWIRWNLKDIRALLPTEITALLAAHGSYHTALRLRESYALELQQRLLASIGRVGLTAPMPATFPVEVSGYYVDTSGASRALDLPITAREGGVCYTGRDADAGESSRLVLTEPAIDELVTAISKIGEDSVIARSKETLRKLKLATSLAKTLQMGLDIPSSNKVNFAPLKALVPAADGEKLETVGLVVRNPGTEAKPEVRNSNFILVIRDKGFVMAQGGISEIGSSGDADSADRPLVTAKPLSQSTGDK